MPQMKLHQDPTPRKDAFILSYLELRRIVGFTGLALPILLAVGKILSSTPGVESSISNYYYTDMRNIFVGTMCVIGIFLAACRGYDQRDTIAGRFAGICAIALALFPTVPDGTELSRGYISRAWHAPIGAIHLGFALLFFLTIAYFCLRLFTLTSTSGMTPRKRLRNRIYVTCGWTVLACIGLSIVVKCFEGPHFLHGYHPVFWLESLACAAFGTAWLTKGEWLLRDDHTILPARQHSAVTYIDSPAQSSRIA